jgi:hypothetical protein
LRSFAAQIGIVDILISFEQVNKLIWFIDADEEIGSEDTASEDPEEASEDDSLSDIITRAQGDLGSVLQTPAPRRRPTHTGGKPFYHISTLENLFCSAMYNHFYSTKSCLKLILVRYRIGQMVINFRCRRYVVIFEFKNIGVAVYRP